MSKYQHKKSSIYYPDSDVPVNKTGTKDSDTIQFIEETLLSDSYAFFISKLNDKTIFDEHYFKELHQRTFESLYDWAGEYRNKDMSKGGSMFCRGEHVGSSSKKIFAELAQENYFKDYWNIPKEEFAKKLGYLKCELIALHPFYEFNGRITRLFIDLIAIYNGYTAIKYPKLPSVEYMEASIVCVQRADSDNIEKLILNGLYNDKK